MFYIHHCIHQYHLNWMSISSGCGRYLSCIAWILYLESCIVSYCDTCNMIYTYWGRLPQNAVTPSSHLAAWLTCPWSCVPSVYHSELIFVTAKSMSGIRTHQDQQPHKTRRSCKLEPLVAYNQRQGCYNHVKPNAPNVYMVLATLMRFCLLDAHNLL